MDSIMFSSFVDLFLFCVCVCHIVLPVSCSLVVNCWERADLLVLLCVMFSCVLCYFPTRYCVRGGT